MKQQQGFAILITSIILSIAGIVYTANIAYLQLIDNKVLSNYYRNNEAFLNAESGVNLILNKLTLVAVASDMLNNLPFTYPAIINSSSPYQVTVTQLAENKLNISSVGYALDGTALRKISLAVDYQVDFTTPTAALLSNGKLNVNGTDYINDGCEGLTTAQCRSPGSIAEQIIISQPDVSISSVIDSTIEAESAWCVDNSLTESNSGNQIDLFAIHGDLINSEGIARFTEVNESQWEVTNVASGDLFEHVPPLDDTTSASSLFESTFGMTWPNVKQQFITSDKVAHIDMTTFNPVSCSEQLQSIAQDISVVHIKGDCNISSHHAVNHQFTVGSTDNPKMVFMEGGTFSSAANINTSVIGMLYMMPSTQPLLDVNGHSVYIDGVKQIKQDLSVDLAGIRVSGSLLSGYHCSGSKQNNINEADNKSFSIRYDKNALNALYEKLGMTPSSIDYQLVAGSWRDF